MTRVKIHLARILKPVRHFLDGLVEDNGRCLKTHTIIPSHISAPWSEAWQQEGRIPFGRVIGSVSKYLFYDQCFSIMEIHDITDKLLGYYVDISTPVRKDEGEYFLDDLILDLWIYPDQTYLVLDEEEWQQAVQGGLVSKEIQSIANRTLARLKKEIHAGKFPGAYIKV